MSLPGSGKTLVTVECPPRRRRVVNQPFEVLLERAGVDLTRLRGRRGVVRCIFHEDRHPSLSLDLDRGLFHCFSCGEGGGLRRLREILGEVASPAPSPRESPLRRARRAIFGREAAVAQRHVEWTPWWNVNAHIHRCTVAVEQAHTVATQLGPDDARTWPLLERAARVEADSLALEAELDTLAVGRLA
jgi:hypothetical protein